MKKIKILSTSLLLSLVLFACLEDATKSGDSATPQQGSVESQQADTQRAAAPISGEIEGTCIETMNAAGYTYIHIDTGDKKVWVAAPELDCKVGDEVVVPPGMPMSNFHSKTLNRDFEEIFFVGTARLKGDDAPASGDHPSTEGDHPSSHSPDGQGQPAMPAGHPSVGQNKQPEEINLTGIKKVEGGETVADVFEKKDSLAGKEIQIRGKVVKFSSQIMNKNWLHLRDGSGSEGTNDLTITTNEVAKVGDLVVITGALSVDKDFGAGYKYPVIIEDAKITFE